MFTIRKISTSKGAANYFSKTDDYYSKESRASAKWYGVIATKLNLPLEVNQVDFSNLLNGVLPNGIKIGQKNHTPGCDITLGACKSLSALALAAGDKRLVEAHEVALLHCLKWAETNAAFTRVKSEGLVELVKSDGIIAATFRHETSRNKNPHLHTHCIVMNIAFAEKYRSLDSNELFNIKMHVGQMYRDQLAIQVKKLGYKIRQIPVGKLGIGFEIEGVSEKLLDHWSSRSNDIESFLEEKGLSRDSATAQQKQHATLATRKAKSVLDHNELRSQWLADAEKFNVDLKLIVANAEANCEHAMKEFEAEAQSNANKAVNFAIEKLEEHQSVFSKKDLIKEASKYSFSLTTDVHILSAVEHALDENKIYSRPLKKWDKQFGGMVDVEGFSSERNLEIESRMLAAARKLAGRNSFNKSLMSESQARIVVDSYSRESEYKFNDGQFNAAVNILSSSSKLNLIQGYAGTSKTNSVMTTLASEFSKYGFEVHALAPTGSAAATLGDAIKADGKTIQSYLNEKVTGTGKHRVLIVDEASMISADDMRKLLERAEKHGDRIILTGDLKQLGSVAAGEAFRQLQDDGHQVEILDEIVRQTNEQLKQAVYDSLEGRGAEALSKITTIELQERSDRIQAIKNLYQSKTEREKMKTIIVAPGRDDRTDINDAIREDMIKNGELGELSIKYQINDVIDLTKAERKEVRYYQVGQHIEFERDYKNIAVLRRETTVIESIDTDANMLNLKLENGRRLSINPKNLSKFSVFEKLDFELREGDKVIRKANGNKDNKEYNSNEISILEVDPFNQKVKVREGRQIKELSVDDLKKIDYAYAVTAHQSQGKTFDEALLLAESYRSNLVNQRSIYVQMSRAKNKVTLITDDRTSLAQAIKSRSGQKETAIKSWEDALSNEKQRKLVEENNIKSELRNIGVDVDDNLVVKQDKSELDWKKIQELKKAEFERNRTAFRIRGLSLARERVNKYALPKYYSYKSTRGIKMFENLSYNVDVTEYNIDVFKRRLIKRGSDAWRMSKILKSLVKFKIQDHILKHDPAHQEARKLREKMILEQWDKNAAKTFDEYKKSLEVKIDPVIEKSNHINKVAEELVSPEFNLNEAERVEHELHKLASEDHPAPDEQQKHEHKFRL